MVWDIGNWPGSTVVLSVAGFVVFLIPAAHGALCIVGIRRLIRSRQDLNWGGALVFTLVSFLIWLVVVVLSKPIGRLTLTVKYGLGQRGFRGADLSNADLTDLDMSGSDLRGADLGRADLCRIDLSRSDLSGAGLAGADLQGANLGGGNLTDGDLRAVNLAGTHLRRADLRSADLTEAGLSGAVVTGSQLDSAKPLERATLPDGTIHE
jgi:hypothetical protein